MKLAPKELKVGMKVKGVSHDKTPIVGVVESVVGSHASLRLKGLNHYGVKWGVDRKPNGTWGADNGSGKLYLVSGGNNMESVKDIFKSEDQKLLEKYVFNGDGIDWSSHVMQRVLLQENKAALIAACKTAKKKEEKEDK